MARKPLKRAIVKDFPVAVLLESGMTERSGADLDSVLQGILFDIHAEVSRNLPPGERPSVERTAHRLGLTQQNLDRILKHRGTSLKVLSAVCASVKDSPTDLFRRHERYRAELSEAGRALFTEDQIYARLRHVLGPSVERFADVLERLTGTPQFDAFLEFGERMVGIEPPKPPAADDDSPSAEVRKLATAHRKTPKRRGRAL